VLDPDIRTLPRWGPRQASAIPKRARNWTRRMQPREGQEEPRRLSTLPEHARPQSLTRSIRDGSNSPLSCDHKGDSGDLTRFRGDAVREEHRRTDAAREDGVVCAHHIAHTAGTGPAG